MYCHYCGEVATANCAACDHRVCPAHARRLLGVTVCRKCRPFVTASLAFVALLAGVAWVALR